MNDPLSINDPRAHEARTRRLNDALRRFHVGGRVLLSLGITCLSDNAIASILNAVRTYDGFSAENDSDNLHDFGIIEVGEHTVMFKIDVASAPRSAGISPLSPYAPSPPFIPD
ncbi:DUF3768 domain-containing protein [Chelatococcus asaccharovorans]|uniref:Uncharacterized protein DUF3768 n=1 Tax=Chelatococcus asaccharovorans TaxID=28210 RepID=A0A2V3UK06_9HYPH|nr:DUF3768 domain-containing protein [Chelatococcus asaccharovorans]MBS7706262.1 DUF3768 domain-containing protein [Chelatococcus asaccharovorans]PXW65100.1 uncharacterized protein DUF3768 [Chelatococcus asaccharovorans]